MLRFLEENKSKQTRVVPPELTLASMQHISSFARIQDAPSTIINNRDKRLALMGSIIMTIGLVLVFWIFPVMTTHAEAPTDTTETTIPTITSDTASRESITNNNLAEVSSDKASEPAKLVDGLTVEQRAAKIDAFFTVKGNLPLAGQGVTFVTYADKYGIDWRLIPAKSFRETTGGKFACKKDRFNAFGWGSCRGEKFDSYEDAIETVTRNLSGNNPNTAYFYKGKSVDEIIDAYNPPSVAPKNYKQQIKDTMAAISNIEAPSPINQLAVK